MRALAPHASMSLRLLAPLRAVLAAGSRQGPSYDGGDCALRMCASTVLTMREGTRTRARDRTCTHIRTPHHTWAAKRNGGAAGAEGDKADGSKGVGDDGDGAAKVRDGVRALGKLLLTASADTTAKVWDVDSRELVAGRASTSLPQHTHARTYTHGSSRVVLPPPPPGALHCPPMPAMMMTREAD